MILSFILSANLRASAIVAPLSKSNWITIPSKCDTVLWNSSNWRTGFPSAFGFTANRQPLLSMLVLLFCILDIGQLTYRAKDNFNCSIPNTTLPRKFPSRFVSRSQPKRGSSRDEPYRQDHGGDDPSAAAFDFGHLEFAAGECSPETRLVAAGGRSPIFCSCLLQNSRPCAAL